MAHVLRARGPLCGRCAQPVRSAAATLISLPGRLSALVLCVASPFWAAQLSTRQTAVQLLAGASQPALTRLSLPNGPTWRNNAAADLITFAYVDGHRQNLTWNLNPHAGSPTAREVAFVYDSSTPRLRLTWSWTARSLTGPIEHTTTIQNLDTKEVWLPLQNSITLSIPVDPAARLTHFYVEKGAGKPSPVGTHAQPMPAGYRWTGTSSTYAQFFRDEPREIIPWFAVETGDVNASGWYIGVEFSGRVRLSCERTPNAVQAVVGLNPEPGNSFRTRLQPGETFATPTIFLGAYTNGIDGMGKVLRPWVRKVLGHAEAWRDPRYPLLVNNSWGSGMQVDEALAQRMIRDSAELGLEMFHIDAGWFRGVGDWYPNPKKFPRGLAFIADDAHRHGLRFGIWVDWTQAGVDREPGALNVYAPSVRDWMLSDLPPGWRPQEFKGETIDIGDSAARSYAQGELERLVSSYKLDMLEHDGYLVAQGCIRRDHAHAPPDSSNTRIFTRGGNSVVESSNCTDVSYHAVRAYYDLYANLRRRHPNLLLEICNDGGRMVDFGSAAHGDYFSITDTYDPLSNRQAFYDASHLLPAAMLESYVEKWPTPKLENFRYMLRSGMMGWLTLMLDTTQWNEAQHAAAKAEIQVYKRQLRPLIRDASLYHVAARPTASGWDGIEYFNSAQNKGVLYAFRGSQSRSETYTYRLKGLDSQASYRLHFQDGSSPDRMANGADLLKSGLAVTLSSPASSELVFLSTVP